MLRKKKNRPFVSAIIVAAGNASRMDGVDKQFVEIGGTPVIIRSILAFEHSGLVDEMIVVTKKESIPELNHQVRNYAANKVRYIVAGGGTRQESVFNGVSCVHEDCKYIAIHDGARPLVLTGAIDACIGDAVQYGAALLGVRVKDTIKAVDEQRFITKTIDREKLFLAQTPQIFELGLYKQAMSQAAQAQLSYTDDCQLIEAAGHKVHVSPGHYSNIKITTPDDLFFAEALLGQMGERL